MFTLPIAFGWLVEAAATSLPLFAIGSAAALACRQPIRRMRLIVLTLAACVLAPALNLVPGLPHWSLPRQLAERHAKKIEDGGSRMEDRESKIEGRGWTVEDDGDEHETDVDSSIAVARPSSPVATATPSDLESTLQSAEITAPPTGGLTSRRSPSSARSSILDPQSSSGSRFSFPADLRPAIASTYLAGLAGLAAWWLVGLAGLCRVLRGSVPAPQWCREVLREISGPAGDRVQILVSPRAAQPFTFAWRRPVIVLPQALLRENGDQRSNVNEIQAAELWRLSTAAALRWSLAHEWSHVARGDVWTWSLAGVVRLVYFYQPLAWWLRQQLRLCQDYLADAAAARQSCPTDYAEFLTTRAAGRPLILGLGITAGKSDLYRRVAMLLTNQHPLESRCPRTWTAGVAAIAAALVLCAGTFGDRTTSQAAAPAQSFSVPTSSDAAAIDPAVTLDSSASLSEKDLADADTAAADLAERERNEIVAADRKNTEAPRDKAAAEPATTVAPNDAEKQKLIEGVLAGVQAIKSGVFEYSGERTGQSGRIQQKVQFVFSGENWAHSFVPEKASPRTTSKTLHAATSASDAGHYFDLRGNGLTIDWPRRAADGVSGPSPIPNGANWAASLREQAEHVRVLGTEVTNGIETRILEWPVPETDGASRPDSPKLPRTGATTVRLCVAPQLGFAVVKFLQRDRFGLAISADDFSEFKEVAPGIFLPFLAHRLGDRNAWETKILSVANLNEPIPEHLFQIRIPAGTRIKDNRPHRNDSIDAEGNLKFDAQKYPLREFTTVAEDLNGLPPAVLAEMDRDVFSKEEWSQIESGRKYKSLAKQSAAKGKSSGAQLKLSSSGEKSPEPAAASSPATTSQPAAASNPAVNRTSLRYGGKTFEEWRQTLLTDLEPQTRVKAIDALKSFGKMAYEEEILAAIQEVLNTDDEPVVQMSAFELLAGMGARAVPVLEERLASESPKTRQLATNALRRVVAKTAAAVPALLKAAKDVEREIRASAFSALVLYQPQVAGVFDAWRDALSQDDDWVQESILRELLETRTIVGDFPAPAIFKPLESHAGNIRVLAATVLAVHGPGSEPVADKIKLAILGWHPRFRRDFVNTLCVRKPNPAASVPILIALLEAESTYEKSDERTALVIIQALAQMPMDGPAGAALPVLVKAVAGSLPGKSREFRTAALDALGKAGVAASAALPGLKRVLDDESRSRKSFADVEEWQREINWRSHLESAIRKIEGK